MAGLERAAGERGIAKWQIAVTLNELEKDG